MRRHRTRQIPTEILKKTVAAGLKNNGFIGRGKALKRMFASAKAELLRRNREGGKG